MGDWRLRLVGWLTLVVVAFSSNLWSRAEEVPVLFPDPQGSKQWENREVRLGLVAPAGVYRVESSDTLSGWDALATLKGMGSNLVTAVAPPDRTARFYRAVAGNSGGAAHVHERRYWKHSRKAVAPRH